MEKFILTLFCCIPVLCKAQPELSGLDGTITEQEKEMLTYLDETADNKIYLDTRAGNLHLAVESEKLYVASVCIASGDRVIVFHASAALGHISYALGDNEGWTTNEEFLWGMRDTDMSDATIQKRRDYFRNHGWVSNTMGMGEEGQTEFIINMDRFKGSPVYIAAGLMPESNPDSIIPLPAGGAGECAAHSLVSGSAQKSYLFSPGSWYELEIK